MAGRVSRMDNLFQDICSAHATPWKSSRIMLPERIATCNGLERFP